jgi:hypothetical protein
MASMRGYAGWSVVGVVGIAAGLVAGCGGGDSSAAAGAYQRFAKAISLRQWDVARELCEGQQCLAQVDEEVKREAARARSEPDYMSTSFTVQGESKGGDGQTVVVDVFEEARLEMGGRPHFDKYNHSAELTKAGGGWKVVSFERVITEKGVP